MENLRRSIGPPRPHGKAAPKAEAGYRLVANFAIFQCQRGMTGGMKDRLRTHPFPEDVVPQDSCSGAGSAACGVKIMNPGCVKAF